MGTGFSGEIVTGRSAAPLPQAPVFRRAGWSVSAQDVRPGGWQSVRCGYGGSAADPPSVLRDLVAWTRAPACAVSVHGGRYGLARGLTPAGGWWEAWLNLDAAAEKLAEVPDDVSDPAMWIGGPGFAAAVARKRAALDAGVPVDARGALAWARAAGFGGDRDPARVEAVLRSKASSVEPLIPALFAALGFPPASPAPSNPAASNPGGPHRPSDRPEPLAPRTAVLR